MKRAVIHFNSLPTSLPITKTLLLVLALDHWHAAGWVWGVMLALVAIIWFKAIRNIISEECVDVFSPDSKAMIDEITDIYTQSLENEKRRKEENKTQKSKFVQKLEKVVEESKDKSDN